MAIAEEGGWHGKSKNSALASSSTQLSLGVDDAAVINLMKKQDNNLHFSPFVTCGDSASGPFFAHLPAVPSFRFTAPAHSGNKQHGVLVLYYAGFEGAISPQFLRDRFCARRCASAGQLECVSARSHPALAKECFPKNHHPTRLH